LLECIIAFELLGQFLLSISRRGKSIDGCYLFRIGGCVITQSTDRFTQIVQLLNEGVIVAQHTGARAEDIPVQRNLHQRETVERFGCAIIPFRIGVDCTERQPVSSTKRTSTAVAATASFMVVRRSRGCRDSVAAMGRYLGFGGRRDQNALIIDYPQPI